MRKNTYDPERGKKGERAENFIYSLFKEKLELNIIPFPRGVKNEDFLVLLENRDLLLEVEIKDIRDRQNIEQNFSSKDYIDFSSRRKIRKNCYQIVLNNTHTRFLIYSHDVIQGCEDDISTNSETGEEYLVKKIPVNFSKEFSVWNFDLEDFYGIINSKENLEMINKNKPRDNKNHYAARYSWSLKDITKNEKHNIMVMDVVIDWVSKVDEKSTAKKPMSEADKYIRQKYGLSESVFREFKDKIGLSKKTARKSPLSSYALAKNSKGKTCDEIRKYIENTIKSVKEETLSKRSENKSDQQPSSSTSLPDISKEYNNVETKEEMPSRLGKLKEIINSNISDDLKEELIKKLTQENVNQNC